MAKAGLEYYRCFTDRFQERKIRKLVRKYSGNGHAVYSYIETEIYRVNGCFLEWDEDFLADIAGYFNIEETLVKEIVDFCCESGLFEKRYLESHSVLTSDSFIDLYRDACRAMKRKNCPIPDYLNVPEEFRNVPEGFQNVPEGFQNVPEEFRNVPEGFQNVPEEFRNVPEGFQNVPDKVKESKVKETESKSKSKVNKNESKKNRAAREYQAKQVQENARTCENAREEENHFENSNEEIMQSYGAYLGTAEHVLSLVKKTLSDETIEEIKRVTKDNNLAVTKAMLLWAASINEEAKRSEGQHKPLGPHAIKLAFQDLHKESPSDIEKVKHLCIAAHACWRSLACNHEVRHPGSDCPDIPTTKLDAKPPIQ